MASATSVKAANLTIHRRWLGSQRNPGCVKVYQRRSALGPDSTSPQFLPWAPLKHRKRADVNEVPVLYWGRGSVYMAAKDVQ